MMVESSDSSIEISPSAEIRGSEDIEVYIPKIHKTNSMSIVY